MKYAIAISVVTGVVYLLGICICIAARRADEQAEKMARLRHKEFIERTNGGEYL